MPVPEDRLYSKEHEWALIQSDGSVIVGITDFAQHELGDVVYLELPSQGANVIQHQQMGEIESVKAVSEVFSPVSGVVLEVNTSAQDSPELVNSSPYEEGWLIKVQPSDEAELKSLLDAKDYVALTE
ncbi:MAG: glycine cleavage system protein H [Chloroflexi bacterium]|nr:glycine cleavage system protein H [Chloroflexota bacterium]MCH2532612.1 glycine cleavage system protein GcvH [Dehalococcoidia bacterium]HCH36356.1 glycine cleavage system protein GcvH [Dehalococcoidia bacterium]|tara:strand:- start:6312 stop:6692 length:381 start_codon:yes stop_codon:yes gene_type:complete